ncbi:cysteine hydrolase family protein [Bartonella tamiae]|uniref:cysteine hydrolase family protein n=1 Tax=Bartonella tamiae TaxID=373638 RepID=UPI0009DA5459|nr:isochorismatase family cysteine hydrolase [Bartonella tamiae]
MFAKNSPTSSFQNDIQPHNNQLIIIKDQVSVFASTDIDKRLKEKGINTLIITGLMTHACVSGAARDAVPNGYNVIIVDDACAARQLNVQDHQPLSDVQVHEASFATINEGFVQIFTTDEVLKFELI